MKKIIIALLAICGLASCKPVKTTVKQKVSQDKDSLILQSSEQEPIQNYRHRSHASHASHYSSR